jgi:hypothetical protein
MSQPNRRRSDGLTSDPILAGSTEPANRGGAGFAGAVNTASADP